MVSSLAPVADGDLARRSVTALTPRLGACRENGYVPPLDDIADARRVLQSLKRRLAGLTLGRPRAGASLAPERDAPSWSVALDVDGWVRMWIERRFDDAAVSAAVDAVYAHLMCCCSPVQDEAVAHAHRLVRSVCDPAQKMAYFCESCDAILRDIDLLTAQPGADAGVP